MTITTSYLEHYSAAQPEQMTLENVIHEIQSDQHSTLVTNIRNEKNKDDRNELKRELPMFFPTIQMFASNALDPKSIPTGIVQFDIDLQDNENANFDDMKSKVIAIPETIYAFVSPSGGLKFGIRTDFSKNTDDCTISLKARFKQAYKQCLDYVSTFTDINDDENMQAIKYACFLSHDPDAYLNTNCAIFNVNDSCVFTLQPLSVSNVNCSPISTEFVGELLSFIPKDLRYHQRLPINYAVFNSIGTTGIVLLIYHWSTSNRTKLRSDLERDAQSPSSYGHIGHLINQAKKYGYKSTPPRSRRTLKSKPSDYQFERLFTVKEAKVELDKHIESFFADKKSMFLNVSTGFGKTQTVLNVLRHLPRTSKVLYLVNNHSLANEIKDSFLNIESDNSTFRKKVTAKSVINHIRGKTFKNADTSMLCQRPDTVEKYEKDKISMPVDECKKACLHTDTCPYLRQFSLHKNIRLMTHDEVTNIESIWFNGAVETNHDSMVPKLHGGKWKPDYIIIDEDWIKRRDDVEYLQTSFDSIRNIINACMNGDSLTDAIKNNHALIVHDYKAMKRNKAKYVPFRNTKQYIKAVLANKQIEKSVILKVIYDYVIHGFDEDKLGNLRFDPDRKILILSKLNQIAKRYGNIPTLYLDATADELIVKSAVGDIDFHSIRIKSNESINVYQLENYCWSKNRLKDVGQRDELISELKTLASKYNSVGLITYKNIPNIDDFDAWLAEQLRVEQYAHFMNLRGLNAFNDVDCLLVVGRHMLPQDEIHDHYHAIFNDSNDFEQDYIDVSIRMKDGRSRTLSNKIYSDPNVQRVAQHFSISETIQAVGRARLIHGKPKDVYLFSNESLGSDIEITDFFGYEVKKFNGAMSRLKDIGFCKNKPKELKNIGLSEHHIKHNRSDIDKEFVAGGLEVITVTFRNSDRKPRSYEYYISDQSTLVSFLNKEGATKIIFKSLNRQK